jgi:hypothetical protein
MTFPADVRLACQHCNKTLEMQANEAILVCDCPEALAAQAAERERIKTHARQRKPSFFEARERNKASRRRGDG